MQQIGNKVYFALSDVVRKILIIECFLLTFILAGCSNDTFEDGSQNTIDMEMISPLVETELNQDILNFFNEEMSRNRVKRSKGFFTSLAESEETYLIINSDNDFQNAYKGDYALPVIDFQHYTLILGKLYMDASYMLEGQYLAKNDHESQLVLCFKKEPAVADMLPLYYWGIYKKEYFEKITIKKEIK